MTRRSLGLVVAGMLMGAMGSRGAEAGIVINEVLANPGGQDVNGDGVVSATQDEFVELANTGAAVAIGGWTLADAISTRHVFAPDAQLAAGGLLVLFGGGTPTGIANAAVISTGGLSLNNGAETFTLLNADGLVVDQWSATTSPTGRSLTRVPDGTGAFEPHPDEVWSPGLTIAGLPSLEGVQAPPVPGPDPAPLPQLPPGTSPVVPEPSSLGLFGLGLSLVGASRRLW